MTIRLPSSVHAALGRVLSEMGIRAIRNGSVTLQFDAAGAFVGWREQQDRRVTREPVALGEETAQNTGTHNAAG